MAQVLASNELLDKLNELRDELESLRLLAAGWGKQVDLTLCMVEPPRSDEEVVFDFLRRATNAQLRAAIVAARGERSACVLRTKLNFQLEQNRGRRHACNGAPRVGNGASGNGQHPTL
jgi:hypothetical protein